MQPTGGYVTPGGTRIPSAGSAVPIYHPERGRTGWVSPGYTRDHGFVPQRSAIPVPLPRDRSLPRDPAIKRDLSLPRRPQAPPIPGQSSSRPEISIPKRDISARPLVGVDSVLSGYTNPPAGWSLSSSPASAGWVPQGSKVPSESPPVASMAMPGPSRPSAAQIYLHKGDSATSIASTSSSSSMASIRTDRRSRMDRLYGRAPQSHSESTTPLPAPVMSGPRPGSIAEMVPLPGSHTQAVSVETDGGGGAHSRLVHSQSTPNLVQPLQPNYRNSAARSRMNRQFPHETAAQYQHHHHNHYHQQQHPHQQQEQYTQQQQQQFDSSTSRFTGPPSQLGSISSSRSASGRGPPLPPLTMPEPTPSMAPSSAVSDFSDPMGDLSSRSRSPTAALAAMALLPTPPLPHHAVDFEPRSSSRRGSPRLGKVFSALSNRISSRMSSRMSSRVSSPISSRVSSRRSSRPNSGLEVPLPTPPVEDFDNNWAEFVPRRYPASEVVEQLSYLGHTTAPLVDIDERAKKSQLNTHELELSQSDVTEARSFAARGLYYYTSDNRLETSDEEGNYLHHVGEQIGFRYSVVNLLGKGSFGKVLQCRDHKTGRMVAIKVTARRSELQSQVKIEAQLLRSLLSEHNGNPGSHHFVRYIEHFKFRGHMCIVTELLGPNLYEILRRNQFQGLGEPAVRYITRQLVEGLEFLTSQGIIHCDLKPENVLVSDVELCQVKIVDFGSGCYEGKRLYTYIQSRFYRAPEILLGMPYGPAIDMWSLGAIVPELLLGRPLFPSDDEADQIALMCQYIGSPSRPVLWRCSRSIVFFDASGFPLRLENSKGVVRGAPGATPLRDLLSFTPDGADFVDKILQWSPESRLTASKAIVHPFVIGQ